MAIYPTNNAAIVQKLADLLQFDLDQVSSVLMVSNQSYSVSNRLSVICLFARRIHFHVHVLFEQLCYIMSISLALLELTF